MASTQTAGCQATTPLKEATTRRKRALESTVRAVFVDLQSAVVNEVPTGTYRQQFHPEQLIPTNNSARGHFPSERRSQIFLLDCTGQLAENCFGLQGFLLFIAFVGGTGSGLGCLLLWNVCPSTRGTSRISVSRCRRVHRSQQCKTVLCVHSVREHTDEWATRPRTTHSAKRTSSAQRAPT